MSQVLCVTWREVRRLALDTRGVEPDGVGDYLGIGGFGAGLLWYGFAQS